MNFPPITVKNFLNFKLRIVIWNILFWRFEKDIMLSEKSHLKREPDNNACAEHEFIAKSSKSTHFLNKNPTRLNYSIQWTKNDSTFAFVNQTPCGTLPLVGMHVFSLVN